MPIRSLAVTQSGESFSAHVERLVKSIPLMPAGIQMAVDEAWRKRNDALFVGHNEIQRCGRIHMHYKQA